MDRHKQRGGKPGRDDRRAKDGRGRPHGRPPRPSGDERLSRFLAFVLRHHPDEVGLTLDEKGLVDLDGLAEAIRARPGFETATREKIEHLVTSGPGVSRFEIIGDRVRARYGHSLSQPIEYPPADPPENLFRGTTPESADQILAEGLKADERQRVHLSIDTPAAREIGLRRCPDPAILRVDTSSAVASGIRFYRAGPSVWLADDIPPEHIARVDQPPAAP